MKKWFKLWKKSGPMQGLNVGYAHCDEEDIDEHMEDFAENVGGGFNSRYTYGYEEIKYPPKEWIKNHIEHHKKYIETLEKELKEFEEILEDYSVDEAFN